MSFSLDLSKAIEGVKGDRDKIARGTLAQLSSNVITRSPVGNPDLWVYNAGTKEEPRYVDYIAARGYPDDYVGGSLRGAWQASLDAPDYTENNRVQDDEYGEANIEAAGVANSMKIGQTFYLTNPLPYARRVEFGHSTQAAEGMVRVSLVEAQQVLDSQ